MAGFGRRGGGGRAGAGAWPFGAALAGMLLLGAGGGALLLGADFSRLYGALAERVLAPEAAEAVSGRFAVCTGARRVTCVVDGDTIWLEGTKIRIADMNAPEAGAPQCAAEAALAQRATERLVVLLNAGPFEVRSAGGRDMDQYGRARRVLDRDGRSLGDMLVAEGLAHRWEGARLTWC